jgi:hypothetical protein
MMTKLKPYIILLLKYAFATYMLHWFGGFTWMATIALLVFLPVGESWTTLPRVDTSHFTPYEICLSPHVGKMLLELGLVTEEKWSEIAETEHPSDPRSPWRLVNYGIQGVVLSFRDGEELVHWSGTGHYTASVEYRCHLDFLELPGEFLQWSPCYFFRIDKGGYHQGITVHPSWWDQYKEILQAKGLIKNVHDERWGHGLIYLSLSVFPPEALRVHYREWSAKLNQAVRARAEELEWKFGDVGPDFGPSVDYFENKYGNVALRSIERDR